MERVGNKSYHMVFSSPHGSFHGIIWCLSGSSHGHVSQGPLMVMSWSLHGPHGRLMVLVTSHVVLSQSLPVPSEFSKFPHGSLKVIPSQLYKLHFEKALNILPKTFETKKHVQQVFYLKHLVATLKNRKYL